MAEFKIELTIEHDGPVDRDYVQREVDAAIEHWRFENGLSRGEDEGGVTSVTSKIMSDSACPSTASNVEEKEPPLSADRFERLYANMTDRAEREHERRSLGGES